MCQDSNIWPTTDLHAFERIVSNHFCIGVRHYSPMKMGSYARVYLFTLENDFQAIGRVVFPVRETVKTEAEVAAMELVRSRTNIPVPQVYLYCSSINNPVGAEWILMEYLPGECLGDCFRGLTYQQKLRTSTDLAGVMSSLFSITASRIGSPLQSNVKDDPNLSHHVLRYPLDRYPSCDIPTSRDVHFYIGPMNDITFLDYPDQVLPELCGPFDSESEFLEAIAFRGRPPTRPKKMLDSWAFEKVLEPDKTFHFSHGDLSSSNILVDPTTGAVTGVVDWEMAGFRPAWLAAVAPAWFNDDSNRFLMTDDQSCRLEYKEDTIGDPELRSHFRLQLAEWNLELFYHYWLGPELRAFFHACSDTYGGNAEIWLKKYEKYEWDVKRRGVFPFSIREWILERLELETKLRANGLKPELCFR